MRIQAYNIKYDGTVDEICTAKLPRRMTFEVDDSFEPENELADAVSDSTGWAVLGCDYKIIKR